MAACENGQEALEEFSSYCDHAYFHSVPRSSDPFLIHKNHSLTLKLPLQLLSLITFSLPKTGEGDNTS